MKKIFPAEILNNSIESFYYQKPQKIKWIYLASLLFFIALIISLPYIKVDITTQSTGIIRPENEDNTLQAAIYGEVILSMLSENLPVIKGDTLIVLDTNKIADQLSFLRIQINDQKEHINDLIRLLSGTSKGVISDLYNQDYYAYISKISEQNVVIDRVKRDHDLAKKLYDNTVMPLQEYEDKKSAYDFELKRLINITGEKKTDWQNKLSSLSIQLEETYSKIEQLKKEKQLYIIKAPISGTISEYSGILPGNFISPNQQIARISPEDKLLVECWVSPSDIGLIKVNMDVSYQLHAFNYNQWGLGSGKVVDISNNVETINNTPFFKVRCSLGQKCLTLKNGYKGYLNKGMTLTARFKITERSLYQLLYDKTDNWLNPKLQ